MQTSAELFRRARGMFHTEHEHDEHPRKRFSSHRFEGQLPPEIARRYRKQPPPSAPPPPVPRPWISPTGFLLLLGLAAAAFLIGRMQPHVQTPAPGPGSTPAPIPTPAQPEVRRAEWVNQWRYHVATMPYGEKVFTKYLGALSNQEALPLHGNHLGDAYQIGRDLFVWVSPYGGTAQWIDPIN